MSAAYTALCSGCGISIESKSLICSGCGRLTRSSELQTLSAEAQRAEAAGDLAASRNLWERAVSLLPSDTIQYRSIQTRILELDGRLAAGRDSHPGPWRKAGATLGPAAL